MDVEKLKKRISRLIENTKDVLDSDAIARAYEIYMGTVTVAIQLYGSNSVQVLELKGEKSRVLGDIYIDKYRAEELLEALHGILKGFLEDLEFGLIQTIENEAQGDVYADFITLAKGCLENNAKDAAAVLTFAALEDSLKKHAAGHGIDVDNLDMSKIISRLKAQSLVKKPEAKILQSYVTVRNKALHAEWDKVGESEIYSALAFVERFVLINFTGDIPDDQSEN